MARCPYPGCGRQRGGYGAGGRYCSKAHWLKDEDAGARRRRRR